MLNLKSKYIAPLAGLKKMTRKSCFLSLASAACLAANIASAQSESSSGGTRGNESYEPLMLSPFEVSDSNDRGYVAGNAISATRINTPISDLPFSITAITPQFIADTGSQNLMDVVTQSAGVKNGTGSGNPGEAVFNVRGFLQSPQRNGFASNPLTSQYVDDSVVDRVEIVKGPASLLYGAISPGGTVNYITKSPAPRPFTELKLALGSYNSETAAIDVNQPIIPAKLFFRMVSTYETTEESTINTKGHTTVLYPTIKWIVTPSLTLLLDYQWLHRLDTPPATYIPNTDIATPASIVNALNGPGHVGTSSLLSGKTTPAAALGFNDGSDPGFLPYYPGVPRNFSISDINDRMTNDIHSINLEADLKLSEHWSGRVHFGVDEDRQIYSEIGHISINVPPPDSLVFSNGVWGVAPSWAAMTAAQQLAAGLAFAQKAIADPKALFSTQNGTPSPATMVRDPGIVEKWLFATTVQAEAVGTYNFPLFKLQLLTGAFYDSVNSSNRQAQNGGTAASPFYRTWDVNPASPTYYENSNEGLYSWSTLSTISTYSVAYNADEAAYALASATFFDDRLYVVGGARYNVSESHVSNVLKNTVSQGVLNRYTTPQLGIGYKFVPNLMVYASYSESYSLPSSPVLTAAGTVNGIPVPVPVGTTVPTIGKGYEMGVKGDLLDNSLNFTVSAYQITQKNVLQTITQSINGFGVTTTSQGASMRGNGAEVTINWSPTKNWAVVASASEEDLRNIKEPAGLEYYLGKTANFTAKTMGNLWARYDLSIPSLKGLWVAGGVNYVGESGGDRRNAAYFIPAYTLLNTAVGCDWRWNKAKMSAVLNFKNMGNTFYRATPNSINEPRRILVSLTAHF